MKYFIFILFSLFLARADGQVPIAPILFDSAGDPLIESSFLQPLLQNNISQKKILLYPNPAATYTWLVIISDKREINRITLFGIDGRIFQRREYESERGFNKYYLTLPSADIELPLFLKVESLNFPELVTVRILRL